MATTVILVLAKILQALIGSAGILFLVQSVRRSYGIQSKILDRSAPLVIYGVVVIGWLLSGILLMMA